MNKKLFLSLWFLFASCFAFAQQPALGERETLDELGQARDLLESAEAEFGRDAIVLVEPLEQLADRLMTLNQFDEADAFLDRAVQITRYHNGLHTPAQLSLIRKRIENFSNRGDWENARELMNYLFQYYQRVPVLLNENLLDDFLALAHQHMRGATEDSDIEQGRHLSRVFQINWAMISTARKLHGPTNPLLAPHLYRQVQHLYLLKKGLDEGGRARVNSNLYYTLNGNSTGWKRSETKRFYFVEGLVLLEQIRDIYVGLEQPDPEGQAMSELYIADWYLLFDEIVEATEGYLYAHASLMETETSNAQVEALFGSPRILPVRNFYASVEEALEDSMANVRTTVSNGSDIPSFELSFSEWSADYPAARSTSILFDRPEEDSDHALVSVQLVDENEPTFFYKHRFRRNIGTPYELELMRNFQTLGAGSTGALDRAQQLRFRPRLVNGLPAASEVVVRYEIGAEGAEY